MNNKNIVHIAFLIVAISVCTSPLYAQGTASIIVPHQAVTGQPIPVVVYARTIDGAIQKTYEGTADILFQSGASIRSPLTFTRGIAYTSVILDTSSEWTVSVEGLAGYTTVITTEQQSEIVHTGDLPSGTITWQASQQHLITGDVLVPVGTVLNIEPGAQILFSGDHEIAVYGTINASGTSTYPILFSPSQTGLAWGGIEIKSGLGEFSHCFFTGGGGDETKAFGHSYSQPVLYAEYGQLVLDHCYVMFNTGKGIGGVECAVTVDSCLIAQCDTGGEIHNGITRISSSYIMDIPGTDEIPVDDDNDGFYFAGTKPGSDEPSVVENTVVSNTRDDGFDHNGARLEVNNCWIEYCDNEGIAASNEHYADVYNTVVRYCGQGIEAGYGAPAVTVDHTVLVGNGVGIRFGDSYDWGCEGSMTVRNSILYGNDDNIRNYDRLTAGPVDGAIAIEYTMTNDAEYDSEPFCLTGIPLFDDHYYLLEHSPGTGAGIHGTDMGLIHENTASSIAINELMASNSGLYCDEYGDFDDWVELYNTGSQQIDIGGMYVSDDPQTPLKWHIPADDPSATLIDPGSFCILWFDGDPDQGTLHVNAKLSASGEQVFLYTSDGTTLVDSVSFGEQEQNQSYGRTSDGGHTWETLTVPTPGLSNSLADTPAIQEYFITCDPADFEHIYANYSEDIDIPITISHGSRTWDAVTMRIRGETSRKYPKKSLRVEFDGSPFSNGRNTLLFNAEYYDTSYMNQYLAYLLFHATGYPSANVEYARLYLNGSFLGLYLRIESIDEDFLESAGLDPDGDLYKAAERGACLSIYDDISYHWDKKTNESTGNENLASLIGELNSISDDDYYTFAHERFDYDRMVDILAINMLLGNGSTYYHNYYMYQDAHGTGKWTMIPWDLDKTFSTYSWNYPYHTSAWFGFRTPDNPFVERALICESMFADIQARIDELHASYFSESYLVPVIDSLKTLIEPSVEEDVTDNITDLATWESTISNTIGYIDQRPNILQTQFAEMPLTFHLIRPESAFRDTVNLSWHPSHDPDGGLITYTLMYSSDVAFPDSLTTTITDIADTTYTLPEILPDGNYYWIVYASDGTHTVEGYDTRSMFTVMQPTTLPSVIDADMHLTQAGSPYVSTGDIAIETGITVTIESGAIIQMMPQASIDVSGTLLVEGTQQQPVLITSAETDYSWGTIRFLDTSHNSHISHTVIEYASAHPTDSTGNAAISGTASGLTLENVIFRECEQAISFTGDTITLSDCTFMANTDASQISTSGAVTNIENCTVKQSADTAIILHNISEGIISGIIIEGAVGHGIVVEGQSTAITITDTRITNCGETGIAINQHSQASIERCLIAGSSIGVSVSDGSQVTIDHVTLADNDLVLVLNKTITDQEGGSALVTNSILADAGGELLSIDDHSTVTFSYCLSEHQHPEGIGMIQGDPQFIDRMKGNYGLYPESPAVDTGDPEFAMDTDGSRTDIGAFPLSSHAIVINEINYHSAPDHDSGDWVELYNIESYEIDMSGWILEDEQDDNGFILPDGTTIDGHGYLVICADPVLFSDQFPDAPTPIGPMGFGFSGSSEVIRLYNNASVLVDSLTYSDEDPWPAEADGDGATVSLVNPTLDNAAGHNWRASQGYGTPGAQNDVYAIILEGEHFLIQPFELEHNFPNPFNTATTIPVTILERCRVRIIVYSILGQRLEVIHNGYLNPGLHHIRFDAARYATGTYIYTVHAGKYSETQTMMMVK